MIVLLHGRELKAGDTLDSNDRARVKVTVTELTEEHLRLRVINYAVKLSVPWHEVEKNFSWPEEMPDTQAELQRYYDTVITGMCKGTTVKPKECVRYSKTKEEFRGDGELKFTRPKEDYEFALTVHLNRPVWVGSVLYVGENQEDYGMAWEVKAVTPEDSLLIVPQGKQGGGVYVTDWRNWAVWDKPVKQKAPTRVYVRRQGTRAFFNVPEKICFSGLSNLSLEFATRKDADEFYEVFNRLNSEKKA